MRAAAREVLDRYGFDLDPAARLGSLSVARRQLVEIARALDRQARILVLDEPSSALTEVETDRLLEILRGLRAEGVAIIYISHKLDEVFAVADRVTVLRDGRTVTTLSREEATPGKVVRLMVGRELGDLYQRADRPAGEVRLAGARPRACRPGPSPAGDRSTASRSRSAAARSSRSPGLLGSGRTESLLAHLRCAAARRRGRGQRQGPRRRQHRGRDRRPRRRW